MHIYGVFALGKHFGPPCETEHSPKNTALKIPYRVQDRLTKVKNIFSCCMQNSVVLFLPNFESQGPITA